MARMGECAFLAAALLAAGCGGDPGSRPEGGRDTAAARDTVIVEGVLTAEGGSCAVLLSDGGVLFSLEDVPAPYDDWERFVDERFLIVGEASASRRCSAGRAIRVIDMGLVLPPALRLSATGGAGVPTT